jgi:4-amino-4-deoxy-L-arabinose transferase-like glycosyltransferase
MLKMRQNLASLKTIVRNSLKDKWRLAFLAFLTTYTIFLLLIGGSMSAKWDEVTHLNGGLFLLQGDFRSYLNYNGFYPPMYDLVTATFYGIGGASVYAARAVSLVFAMLSLFVVFEFGYRLYSPKVGLVASMLMAVMPGFIFLSRLAMIETMLIFLFAVSALLFFVWIRNGKERYLLLSGLALGVGILTKYQVAIVGAIMLTALVVLGRGYLKARLKRFPLLILIAVLVVIPWVIASYQMYADRMLETWLYALNIGNPDKTLYSLGFNSVGGNRFPHFYADIPSPLQIPVFYMLEMSAPYADIHPISMFIFGLGLAGLALFAWRRKPIDKYLLLWFVVIYLFFSAVPNRHWRYVVPVFPVLAWAAASFLFSGLDTARNLWEDKHLSVSSKRFSQVIAGALIVFTLVAVYYNVDDAYTWVAKDQVYIPVQDASEYAANHIGQGESIVVLNAQNLYSEDMVRFYMNAKGCSNTVWQYPAEPVDTYTIKFNVTELIRFCNERNVKYVFTYEFGGTVPYFNTTISLRDIYSQLYDSGNFSKLLENETTIFGFPPRRIFVLSFLGNR